MGYTASYAGSNLTKDLQDIAEHAARNNPRDNVTGALLFDAGRFIQVVEGPADRVGGLLARITRDPRIREMTMLFDETVPVRSMEAWALWVGRTDSGRPMAERDLERFRDMYVRGFKLEALGFTTLLRALIEGPEGVGDRA